MVSSLRPNRRMDGHEHPPLPVPAATLLQMRDDRLADIAGQRQRVASVGLPVNRDLPGTPIKVLQP